MTCGCEKRRGSKGLLSELLVEENKERVKSKNESRGSNWTAASRPGGRFIRLVVSPEPEQGSPARDHALDRCVLYRPAPAGEMA